jgi:CBS domain-containing protein
MSPDLRSKPDPRAMDHPPSGHYLDTEVRNAMTPGVITISEHASVRQAFKALTTHRVHSLLVVGGANGKALGWVTAHGLRSQVTRDDSLISVRDAITHEPASIQPSATVRQALTALGQPGITQLLVATRPDTFPEGVLSDLDVVALAAR